MSLCSHCKRESEIRLTCINCRSTNYCSTICKRSGWEKHRKKCKAFSEINFYQEKLYNDKVYLSLISIVSFFYAKQNNSLIHVAVINILDDREETVIYNKKYSFEQKSTNSFVLLLKIKNRNAKLFYRLPINISSLSSSLPEQTCSLLLDTPRISIVNRSEGVSISTEENVEYDVENFLY